MFPLKLFHSLVSSNTLLRIPHHSQSQSLPELHEDDDGLPNSRNRLPVMLFLPTHELVTDTYRLASIARDIGMDLHPNPSLSHIIFSWPPPPPFSSPSSSSLCSLPNDSVPIAFPSFATTASLSNLRLFANLSQGYFKLAFLRNSNASSRPIERNECLSVNNLDCTSLCLHFARTGERIDSMDGFTKALLGMGWTLYRSSGYCRNSDSFEIETAVYLYRKMDVSRMCRWKRMMKGNGNGDARECSRVRELRLPPLDFRNPPLRILQYIILMTDDAFYLD